MSTHRRLRSTGLSCRGRRLPRGERRPTGACSCVTEAAISEWTEPRRKFAMLRGDSTSSILASGLGLKVEPKATAVVSPAELDREAAGLSDTRRDACRCFDARPRRKTEPVLPARVAGGGVWRALPGGSESYCVRCSLPASHHIVRINSICYVTHATPRMPCGGSDMPYPTTDDAKVAARA